MVIAPTATIFVPASPNKILVPTDKRVLRMIEKGRAYRIHHGIVVGSGCSGLR
jgi:Mg2+/Co2+ transporter CorC